jgi:hypothetical protein
MAATRLSGTAFIMRVPAIGPTYLSFVENVCRAVAPVKPGPRTVTFTVTDGFAITSGILPGIISFVFTIEMVRMIEQMSLTTRHCSFVTKTADFWSSPNVLVVPWSRLTRRSMHDVTSVETIAASAGTETTT